MRFTRGQDRTSSHGAVVDQDVCSRSLHDQMNPRYTSPVCHNAQKLTHSVTPIIKEEIKPGVENFVSQMQMKFVYFQTNFCKMSLNLNFGTMYIYGCTVGIILRTSKYNFNRVFTDCTKILGIRLAGAELVLS